MASHRRIRQLRPDFGTTTFGEIPACTGEAREERLFEVTERLLSKVRYHGIFGIEWLHDVDDDELYLLDFNARPFSSIGHLVDCGLNLPLAAYRELCGESPLGLQPRPPLRHGYWLDFNRDLESFAIKHTRGVLGWREWLATLSRARSFACFTLRDPGPGIYRLGQLAGVVARGVSKYVTRRLRRRFAPR
ncbi:MAG: hypothetical protein GWO02_02465 [Gammaproteobacteria bacterium]|nr:hypothetical protein [Gammaproteobacteria bacterium]